MTIETVYVCDRCGGRQHDNAQFWTLTIQLKAGNGHCTMSTKHSMQMCRTCMEYVGVVPPIDKKVDLPPPLTLEDLIIEIVQNEVGSR